MPGTGSNVNERPSFEDIRLRTHPCVHTLALAHPSALGRVQPRYHYDPGVGKQWAPARDWLQGLSSATPPRVPLARTTLLRSRNLALAHPMRSRTPLPWAGCNPVITTTPCASAPLALAHPKNSWRF
jgi:hypothetical protein